MKSPPPPLPPHPPPPKKYENLKIKITHGSSGCSLGRLGTL